MKVLETENRRNCEAGRKARDSLGRAGGIFFSFLATKGNDELKRRNSPPAIHIRATKGVIKWPEIISHHPLTQNSRFFGGLLSSTLLRGTPLELLTIICVYVTCGKLGLEICFLRVPKSIGQYVLQLSCSPSKEAELKKNITEPSTQVAETHCI